MEMLEKICDRSMVTFSAAEHFSDPDQVRKLS